MGCRAILVWLEPGLVMLPVACYSSYCRALRGSRTVLSHTQTRACSAANSTADPRQRLAGLPSLKRSAHCRNKTLVYGFVCAFCRPSLRMMDPAYCCDLYSRQDDGARALIAKHEDEENSVCGFMYGLWWPSLGMMESAYHCQ